LKIPKISKTFCPYCKTQTEYTLTVAKKRDRGTLKAGSLARLTARGRGKAGFGNHGSKSRKAISAFKRTGAKTSKKSDYRLKCSVCKKMQVKSSKVRSRKFIIETQN